MSWSRFALYGGSAIGGAIFSYYFYKAKYSLHQTEILLLDRFRSLPFYWPPGPPPAEKNSMINAEGLPPDVVTAFAEWFVSTDLQEAGGVIRDDVLELFKELGFSEDHQAAKDFIHRGEGHLEEHKRCHGAGLQESLKLLAALSKAEDGSSAPALGEEAIELLRRKVRRSSSVMAGASALREVMRGPPISATAATPQSTDASTSSASSSDLSSAAASPSVPAAAAAAAAAAAPFRGAAEEDADDDRAVDEEEHRNLEVARLRRIEQQLMERLERLGSLSPAEEARLADVRKQISRV